MARTPTGTTFFIYTSLATAKTVSGISNAAEAVVSCVAHGYANGDVIFIQSGWGRLNKRAYRIKSVATDSFVLEGGDTTNLEFYPAGAGAGSAQKAQTPVQVTQVLSTNVSGGEAKRAQYNYVESDVSYSINDGFNPVQRAMQIDADAFGGAAYGLLRTLTDTGADTVLKTTLKGGSFTLTPVQVALNEEILLQDGQVNRVNLDLAATNRSIRY